MNKKLCLVLLFFAVASYSNENPREGFNFIHAQSNQAAGNRQASLGGGIPIEPAHGPRLEFDYSHAVNVGTRAAITVGAFAYSAHPTREYYLTVAAATGLFAGLLAGPTVNGNGLGKWSLFFGRPPYIK